MKSCYCFEDEDCSCSEDDDDDDWVLDPMTGDQMKPREDQGDQMSQERTNGTR